MSASRTRRRTAGIFVASLALYTLTSYGGIRSPDSEVVYRSAECLATAGSLCVARELEGWPGFGVAVGRDGTRYAIFGPLEAIAAAPVVAAAKRISSSPLLAHAAARAPISHYAAPGYDPVRGGPRPREAAPQLERSMVALLGPLWGALCAATFFAVARRVCRREAAALWLAALFASGSLLWPYAGTWFSELLALWLVLLGLLPLVARARAPSPLALAAAGLCLGLATAAHITALLCAPALGWLAARGSTAAPAPRNLAARGAAFAGGLALPLLALAWFNAARFGDPLETGRGVHAAMAASLGYGQFVAPWVGLPALLISSGKGLLLYCPAVLLGLAGWRRFHAERPALSSALIGLVLLRWLFIASRSDWHGGFALGPRLMLLALPFLLLPAAPWIDAQLDRGARGLGVALVALGLCAAQQWYFTLGEIFAYYHAARASLAARGVDPFAGDRLYLDWDVAPLLHLHEGLRGPALLQNLALSNLQLWFAGVCLLLVLGLGAYAQGRRAADASARSAPVK